MWIWMQGKIKMTLSITTEQYRKMERGDGLEHMGWNNRASHKLHIKGKHLVRVLPEDMNVTVPKGGNIIYTYLNLFEICNGPINVPSVIL